MKKVTYLIILTFTALLIIGFIGGNFLLQEKSPKKVNVQPQSQTSLIDKVTTLVSKTEKNSPQKGFVINDVNEIPELLTHLENQHIKNLVFLTSNEKIEEEYCLESLYDSDFPFPIYSCTHQSELYQTLESKNTLLKSIYLINIGSSFSEKNVKILPKDLYTQLENVAFVLYQPFDSKNEFTKEWQKQTFKELITAHSKEFYTLLPKRSAHTVEIFKTVMDFYGAHHIKYSPFTYFQAGAPHKNQSINMLFFGDLMLDRDVAQKIEFSEEQNPFVHFPQDFFNYNHVVHTNFEGASIEKRIFTSKEIAFNFPPSYLPLLNEHKFNVVTLANNHSYDMGAAGFEETKENLEKNKIEFYGEQYSINENSLLIKEVNGINIGFVGFNDTNRAINKNDALEILNQSEADADFTIVNVHWGQEYKNFSNKNQQNLAHFFIDNGADLVIGHHPHVIQEVEIYNDVPIFYSLGNFVFDQYFSKETQEGFGLGLILNFNSRIGTIHILPHELKNAFPKEATLENSDELIEQFTKEIPIGNKDRNTITFPLKKDN